MDSNKNKKAKPLILEARHTKSLAVSKQTRQKFAKSMFIPHLRYYRYAATDRKKSHSKKGNSQDSEFETLRNSENGEDLVMQLKEKYLRKLMYAKSCRTAENNSNKLFQNTSRCRNINGTIPALKIAKQNSRKTRSKKNQKLHASSTILPYNLNAMEPAISDSRKSKAADKKSADSARYITDSDLLKTEHFLNLREGVKATSTDLGNTKTFGVLNVSQHFINNDLNKTINVNETIKAPGRSQSIIEDNAEHSAVENPAGSPQIRSKFEALFECAREATANLTNKQAVNSPFVTKPIASKEINSSKKLKGNKLSFGGCLFKADLQKVIRHSMPPVKDCTPIDKKINYDLWILDNCAKTFSKCIWQVHKDLDDKEKETRKSVEYARKRDTERAKCLQPNELPPTFGLNQSKSAEKMPKTFTIFIEAANFPKKSITFKTADVWYPKPIANNDTFRDGAVNKTAKASKKQRTAKPKTEAIKVPAHPKRIRSRQKSNTILEPLPQKVKPPIKPIPLNDASRNPTPPLATAPASYFNFHTQNPMYNHVYDTPNYYNYWPQSWPAAREEWHKGDYYTLFQNLQGEPTIELPAGNLEPYQCHNTLLPTSYTHALVDLNVWPNYLPACPDTSIQLTKF